MLPHQGQPSLPPSNPDHLGQPALPPPNPPSPRGCSAGSSFPCCRAGGRAGIAQLLPRDKVQGVKSERNRALALRPPLSEAVTAQPTPGYGRARARPRGQLRKAGSAELPLQGRVPTQQRCATQGGRAREAAAAPHPGAWLAALRLGQALFCDLALQREAERRDHAEGGRELRAVWARGWEGGSAWLPANRTFSAAKKKPRDTVAEPSAGCVAVPGKDGAVSPPRPPLGFLFLPARPAEPGRFPSPLGRPDPTSLPAARRVSAFPSPVLADPLFSARLAFVWRAALWPGKQIGLGGGRQLPSPPFPSSPHGQQGRGQTSRPEPLAGDLAGFETQRDLAGLQLAAAAALGFGQTMSTGFRRR
ncbi:uncharacterized protein LOC122458165 [Dermochelys coriacea]|uniref:uncharacterized protein LOC122458165 n=1 Tax=Dermochelys coriacea TaxID=27794 RepID=UPI001CA9D1AC|nr:uncharacterized protein LOC122458165 [Dermochelys coriacea]